MDSREQLPAISADPTAKPPTIVVGLLKGGARAFPTTETLAAQVGEWLKAGRAVRVEVANGRRVVGASVYPS